MAEPNDTLLQVQELDIELDQLRHRIESLPERAALADLRARRAGLEAAMAEVRTEVDALARRQAVLEGQIAASTRRRHELEQRMRDGVVTAARDLQAVDHEVGQLAERERLLEDEEIVLMEEEEPLDVALADHEQQVMAMSVEQDHLVAAVAEAEVEIRARIATAEAARNERAAGLPVELAERYERLRSHLGGVGAARLVGARCDGCHLTLSSVELERIHHLPSDTLSTCPQCDRILVH